MSLIFWNEDSEFSPVFDYAKVEDGVVVSSMQGKTIDEIRETYPTVVVEELDMNKYSEWYRSRYKAGEVKVIDEDRYYEMLGVVPPYNMCNFRDGAMFRLGESLAHNLRMCFILLNDRYYEVVEADTLSSHDIYIMIKEYQENE